MVRYVGGYQSDDETTRRNTNCDEAYGYAYGGRSADGRGMISGGSSSRSLGGGGPIPGGIGPGDRASAIGPGSSKLQIHRNRSLTGIYSREDFREQYCINDRALQGLEKSRSTGFLFGCLSSYQESPCKKRDNSTSTSGFFTSCYGRQPPIETYYDDEYNRRGAPREYDNDGYGSGSGTGPRYSRYYEFDERGFDTVRGRGSGRFVSRESLYEQAKRYTWDEEMHRYVERISADPYDPSGGFHHAPPPQQQSQPQQPQQQHEDQQQQAQQSSSSTSSQQQQAQQAQQSRMVVTRYPSAPVSAIESTRKHVSFDNSTLARSITASSFDEHKMKKAMNIVGMPVSAGPPGGQSGQDARRSHAMGAGNMNVSQERLLLDSGRKTPEQIGTCVITAAGSSAAPVVVAAQPQPIGSATVIQQQLYYTTQQVDYLGGAAATVKKPLLGTASTCSINSSLMRTQSTQTESFIVRASGPPSYLSLSPRTSYKVCNRQLVRMVSQGAQTNGYLLDSMLKELSSKFSKSIHEINVQTDLPPTEHRPPLPDIPVPPQDPEPVVPPPPARNIDLLDLTNEEEFHENVILGLYSHSKAIEHETMSSSSGSYSVFLDGGDPEATILERGGIAPHPGASSSAAALNMLVMKRILNESPSRMSLPSPSHVAILRPPEGFRDNGGGDEHGLPVGVGTLGDLPPHGVTIFSSVTGVMTDRGHDIMRARKKKPSVRAKSEERATCSDVEGGVMPVGGVGHVVKKDAPRGSAAGGAAAFRRDMMKTDAATQSSISLHASLHDLTTIDDDDSGIYMEPYTSGIWVYIGENEEIQVWKGNTTGFGCYGATPAHEPLTRTSSGESTLSEREFYKKFTALTHRMVHRKASGEIYRRLRDNSLEINKRVSLSRSEGGEFGFRIHGSRPVVVSAVEPNTPAEESGLEVGDVIMSINGVSVLDSSHSDVVRIAKHDVLEMELARTADIVSDVGVTDDVIFRGDLWRFKGHYFVVDDSAAGGGGGRRSSSSCAPSGDDVEEDLGDMQGGERGGVKRLEMWVKRHFILRTDYCLYYYKIQQPPTPHQPLPPASSYFPPLGVIPLSHAHAFLTQPTDEIILLHGAGGGGGVATRSSTPTPSQGGASLSASCASTPSVLYPFELHRTSIIRATARVSELILGCESRDERNEWVEVLDQTIRQAVQDDKWIGISGRYVMGPPDVIAFPDCIGVLNKLGRRFKTWSKRFCVLKDACLYVFLSQDEQTALGAAHLHGYRVQTVSSLAVGGKKHAFELIPPTPTSGIQMRHYYLATDSEHDRKRWLAALEYSIDRWINIGEKTTITSASSSSAAHLPSSSERGVLSSHHPLPPLPQAPPPQLLACYPAAPSSQVLQQQSSA